LAGQVPQARNAEESLKRIRGLLIAGITHVLDLTVLGEYRLGPYEHLLVEEAGKLGRTVSYIRFPIGDLTVPTEARMGQILDSIDDALSEGGKAYVHCHAGIGRTGTVVGCYLVRHGMTGQEALEEIARRRDGISSSEHRSPETDDQRQFVLEWSEPDGKRPVSPQE
jgi:protein-tyrosine phosphatase